MGPGPGQTSLTRTKTAGEFLVRDKLHDFSQQFYLSLTTRTRDPRNTNIRETYDEDKSELAQIDPSTRATFLMNLGADQLKRCVWVSGVSVRGVRDMIQRLPRNNTRMAVYRILFSHLSEEQLAYYVFMAAPSHVHKSSPDERKKLAKMIKGLHDLYDRHGPERVLGKNYKVEIKRKSTRAYVHTWTKDWRSRCGRFGTKTKQWLNSRGNSKGVEAEIVPLKYHLPKDPPQTDGPGEETSEANNPNEGPARTVLVQGHTSTDGTRGGTEEEVRRNGACVECGMPVDDLATICLHCTSPVHAWCSRSAAGHSGPTYTCRPCCLAQSIPIGEEEWAGIQARQEEHFWLTQPGQEQDNPPMSPGGTPETNTNARETEEGRGEGKEGEDDEEHGESVDRGGSRTALRGREADVDLSGEDLEAIYRDDEDRELVLLDAFEEIPKEFWEEMEEEKRKHEEFLRNMHSTQVEEVREQVLQARGGLPNNGRPIDTEGVDMQNCYICLEPLLSGERVAKSDGCPHVMHEECIRGWISNDGLNKNSIVGGDPRSKYKWEFIRAGSCPACKKFPSIMWEGELPGAPTPGRRRITHEDKGHIVGYYRNNRTSDQSTRYIGKIRYQKTWNAAVTMYGCPEKKLSTGGRESPNNTIAMQRDFVLKELFNGRNRYECPICRGSFACYWKVTLPNCKRNCTYENFCLVCGVRRFCRFRLKVTREGRARGGAGWDGRPLRYCLRCAECDYRSSPTRVDGQHIAAEGWGRTEVENTIEYLRREMPVWCTTMHDHLLAILGGEVE